MDRVTRLRAAIALLERCDGDRLAIARAAVEVLGDLMKDPAVAQVMANVVASAELVHDITKTGEIHS